MITSLNRFIFIPSVFVLGFTPLKSEAEVPLKPILDLTSGGSLEAHSPTPELDGHEVTDSDTQLTQARRFRRLQQWDKAEKAYRSYLLNASADADLATVEAERLVCERLAAGWIPTGRLAFRLELGQIEQDWASMTPASREETLGDLAKRYPDRWEVASLEASHHLLQGDPEAARASIASAESLGGDETQFLRERLNELLKAVESAKSTSKDSTALLAKGRRGEAARILQSAWMDNPDAVPVGLRACQLLIENRDFRDGAALAGLIAGHLKSNPQNPHGGKIADIELLAKKALEANEIRNGLAASGRANQPPAGRRAPTPPKKTYADEFLRRAK
jgi:hypothetical protein